MGWTELKIKIPTEYTENAAAVAIIRILKRAQWR